MIEAAKALLEILHPFRPAPLPVNVILPGSRTRAARVDALVEALMSLRPDLPQRAHTKKKRPEIE